MAVVGVGVDHEVLTGLAKSNLQPVDGPAPAVEKVAYHGGKHNGPLVFFSCFDILQHLLYIDTLYSILNYSVFSITKLTNQ